MKNTTAEKLTSGTAIALFTIGNLLAAEPAISPAASTADASTPPVAVDSSGANLLVNTNPPAQWERIPPPPDQNTTNSIPPQVISGMRAATPTSASAPNPNPALMKITPQQRLNLGTNGAFANLAGSTNLSRGGRPSREAIYAAARARMVTNQIAGPGRNIMKPEILRAMSSVPRHQFVPARQLAESYSDKAVDLGEAYRIEPPFAVASVADQLDVRTTDRILELGTGSGYQTAVLSLLAKEVYSIEGSQTFAQISSVNLQRLGYTNNLFLRQGDPSQGWPEAAPFDSIVVNGANQISEAVLKQLKEGGKVVQATENGSLQLTQKAGKQMVPVAKRSVRPSGVAENSMQLREVPELKKAQDNANSNNRQ